MDASAPSLAKPSMVVTLAPSQDAASTVQDFTARPSVHNARPHWLVSQPTRAVSQQLSRSRCTSRVGSTSALAALPLTVRETLVMRSPGVWRGLGRCAGWCLSSRCRALPLAKQGNIGASSARPWTGRARLLFDWSNSRLRHSRGICAIDGRPRAGGIHRIAPRRGARRNTASPVARADVTLPLAFLGEELLAVGEAVGLEEETQDQRAVGRHGLVLVAGRTPAELAGPAPPS